MQIVMFTQSIRSCWNNSNAHFLRGITTELICRGHTVAIYEPRDSWSAAQLKRAHGHAALDDYRTQYPLLASQVYDLSRLDLDKALDGADLVLVHGWNHPTLISRVGAHRARARSYRLLFHDTHHRAQPARDRVAGCDLRDYDGVLTVGAVIRDGYVAAGWAQNAFVWHQAADMRVFRPLDALTQEGDLIWVGDRGNAERSAELSRFLLDPIRQLGLRATVHGLHCRGNALRALAGAGVTCGGWVPNHRVPERFSRFAVTVDLHHRGHVDDLAGIPTIRMFEALACGIPLVSSPWYDVDNLFQAGRDYLVARDGVEMVRHLRDVLSDPLMAHELAEHGRRRILDRHTCGHRVDELLAIVRELGDAEVRPEQECDSWTRTLDFRPLLLDPPTTGAPLEDEGRSTGRS